MGWSRRKAGALIASADGAAFVDNEGASRPLRLSSDRPHPSSWRLRGLTRVSDQDVRLISHWGSRYAASNRIRPGHQGVAD